jgi:hypothetical protein
MRRPTVSGDRAADDAGIDRAHARVVEAEARHDARAELLDQDVAPLEQRLEPAAIRLVFQVDRHRALAAVDDREARADISPYRGDHAHLIAAAGRST